VASGRLANLSILIVGGTSGLGLAAALACKREGANLTVAGRSDAYLEQAADALDLKTILAGDATNPTLAERAVEHAVSNFGKLDGVFHVAGGSGRLWGDGPLHSVPDDAWSQTLDLNLTSLFYTNRAAVRQFLKAGQGGSVLNISSVLGVSPSPGYFATHAYAAAKAAVSGLTKSCAAYYAPHDIRFNAISPGLVMTPASQRAAGDPAITAYVQRKQPLDGGRIGSPQDLDGAVIYFLSPESRFVTGQILSFDGGWGVSDPAGIPGTGESA